MAVILKTVVCLLLGFTDCQLRSSAAEMDSPLVRIFISVVWYSENVLKLGEELSHYINLPKSPFFISFFLSFSLSLFFLAFFLLFCLVCSLSSFRSFLLVTFIALSFFISFPLPPFLSLPLAFFPSFILSPFLSWFLFFRPFFLSDL
jgi:hypothetical protein